MVPPRIIAICGAKRSGKDFLATYLIDKYDYKHIKIAQKLKDVCQILFGFSNDQIENNSKDVVDQHWGVSPRKCMQFIGTELMQYKIQELLPCCGRKFWINSLINSLENDTKYVISDLRFKHEYEELHKLGCLIIKVESYNTTENDTHSSEQEYKVIPADIVVYNDMKTTKILTQIQSYVDHL
jgi:hypothetical protein